MTSPAADLQEAVFRALGDAADLVEALGGPHIYARAPANAPFPHVTFGRTGGYDWRTGAESNTEQLFTLHVWSKQRSEAETLKIMKHARTRLDGQMLTVDDQTSFAVNLDFAEARYDEELEVHHGMLRFRAAIGETV